MQSVEKAEATARKIQWISKLMTWVIAIGSIALVVAYASIWLVPGWLESVAAGTLLGHDVPLTEDPALRAVTALVAAIPLMMLLYGLWQIKHLFELFGNGSYFTTIGSQHLLRFGAALLLAAPAGVITRAISSVLLTMQNEEGSRHLVLQAGSNDYFMIVLGGLLLAVGWVMREAARMASELNQIV